MPYDEKWAEGLIRSASNPANLMQGASDKAKEQFYNLTSGNAKLSEMAKKRIVELMQAKPTKLMTPAKKPVGAFATQDVAAQAGNNFADKKKQEGLLEEFTRAKK